MPDRPQEKRAGRSSTHPWFDVPALPSQPAPSMNVHLCHTEDETVGVVFNALLGKSPEKSCPEVIPDDTTFTISEAMSTFDHEAGKMYIVKRQDPDGIEFCKLSEADKTKFMAARVKEITALIEKGALRIMSVE